MIFDHDIFHNSDQLRIPKTASEKNPYFFISFVVFISRGAYMVCDFQLYNIVSLSYDGRIYKRQHMIFHGIGCLIVNKSSKVKVRP